MDTPVQPAGGEPGVVSASTGEGASFLREVLTPQAPGPVPQAPGIAQPPAQPGVAPTPVQPAMPPAPPVAPPVPPPVQPAAQSAGLPAQPVAQPAVQPPPAPAPVDYGGRYAGPQAPADPLASLQEAPALAPEAPVVPPQNMNEQQNHAWAAIRAQSSQNRWLAEEYRGKYNQIVESTRKFQEERTAFGEQLNAKDKRITELEDEIGRMDLTRSSAFQEKYDRPIQAVCADIARTLEDNGQSPEAAMSLAREVLTVEKAQIPSLIASLPTHVQGIIMVNAEKADQMYAARDQALADWRTSAEGLAAVQERGNSLVAAQHMDKMAEAAVGIIRSMPSDVRPPAYQVVDPAFAADRDAQERKFRSWVSQAPEEQKYAAMLEGFMAPKTYEMLEHVMAENAQLRQIVASRGRLAAPPVASAPGYTPPPPPPPPQQPPTVRDNGFSQAPSGDMAQQFLAQILPGMA